MTEPRTEAPSRTLLMLIDAIRADADRRINEAALSERAERGYPQGAQFDLEAGVWVVPEAE